MSHTAKARYGEYLPGNESIFTIEANTTSFGPGALDEAGPRARGLGLGRAAVFTDKRVAGLDCFGRVLRSLASAGVEAVVYDAVAVEPSDASFEEAAAFAAGQQVDGFVSVGGASVMDTAKAANLLSCWPAPLMDYVNAPVGLGRDVPGPLKPHVACPTTFGTASENTGIAVCDLTGLKLKAGVVSRRLRPSVGLLDPTALDHLPPLVAAANGFDVLSHALESYTARPYTARRAPSHHERRPLSQGANPMSDLASLQAMRLVAENLERGVHDPTDRQARSTLLLAGMLAGIGFGNAGNHLPHAMSYPVGGWVRDYRAPGWPQGHALIPHGIAVAVNAPAVFRRTALATPARHGQALAALGGARLRRGDEIGQALGEKLAGLMRACGMPNGLAAVGYAADDVPGLAQATFRLKRLVDNAPGEVGQEDLAAMFADSLRLW